MAYTLAFYLTFFLASKIDFFSGMLSDICPGILAVSLSFPGPGVPQSILSWRYGSSNKRGAEVLPEETPNAPPEEKKRKVDMSDKEKLRSKKCSAYTRTLHRERKKGTPEEEAKTLAKEVARLHVVVGP